MGRDEALAIFGLDRTAGQEEIRRAYREAAFWCHPDKNPGNKVAEDAFKRVSAAYRLLTSAKEVRESSSREARAPPAPAPRPRRARVSWRPMARKVYKAAVTVSLVWAVVLAAWWLVLWKADGQSAELGAFAFAVASCVAPLAIVVAAGTFVRWLAQPR
jgi:hypothetical protein